MPLDHISLQCHEVKAGLSTVYVNGELSSLRVGALRPVLDAALAAFALEPRSQGRYTRLSIGPDGRVSGSIDRGSFPMSAAMFSGQLGTPKIEKRSP